MSDKCNLCALKVTFDQDEVAKENKVENFFTTLRELQEKNIIEPGYNRRSHWSNTGEGDKSEMCAVNAKYFVPENKNKRCPNFILNMDLNVPEAMSLNLARSTDNLTSDMHKMTKVIVAFTIIATIATIYSVCH